MVVVHHPYVVARVEASQNQENTTSVKVERIESLTVTQAETGSHDFH